MKKIPDRARLDRYLMPENAEWLMQTIEEFEKRLLNIESSLVLFDKRLTILENNKDKPKKKVSRKKQTTTEKMLNKDREY